MLQNYSISQRIASQLGLKRWLVHVFYWLAWIAFWAVLWGTFDNNYYKTFYIQLLELPFKLAMVYPVIYWLVPRFLLQTRYFRFIIFYALLLFIIGGLMKLMWYYFIDPYYFADRLVYAPLKFTELLNVVLSLNTAVIPPLVFKIIENWMFHQQKSSTLERDKLQAELKFLRTQINPHFLFNALNSVYALSMKQSELTTPTIAHLAEIMRYVIYEASESQVDINKEIAFIENYIAFEQIRLEDDVEVSFSMNNNRSGKIPPLLLLPLIENAFKHLKNFGEEKPWIVIQVETSEAQLRVYVENSIDKEFNDVTVKGIGIENLQKRLDILYKDAYTLNFEKTDFSFKAVLQINATTQK